MHTPIPKNLEILTDHEALTIHRSWKGAHLIFLVFFCLVWDGILAVMFFHFSTNESAPKYWMLFLSIHMMVGLGLTYYTAISFVNKTDVRIDPSNVSVNTHPMPWIGNKSFSTFDIKQLYTTEHVQKNNNGTHITYRVNVLLKDDSNERLVSGLDEKQSALIIEKKTEDVLGIKDEEVLGEV